GAEVAVADLADADALTRAFTGVAGAYVLVPPRPTSADPLADNRAVVDAVAAAVRAAKVDHVVLLSSIGAQHADGTGPIRSLHHAEQALAATGAALTAVRAGYFLENWGGSLGMVGQGVLPTFVAPDRAIPMVATTDIGRVAAAALVEGGHGRSVIELAGPRDYTPDDIAAIVARLAGAPVRAQHAPLDAVVPTFTSFGVGAAFAGLFREMYAGIAAGRVAWEGGAARAVRGTVAADDVLRRLLGR
ncbi:MAG: NAD(P)H-binding protein, partial [Myxococcales bacterium]|nr:NAD(P)H-binding protein [Myxococcales bacterium]